MREFRFGLFLRLLGLCGVLAVPVAFSDDELVNLEAQDLDVSVDTTQPGFNPGNPYVDNWTTTALAINQNLQFSVTPGDSANPAAKFTYAWDFGDGNAATGQSPKHWYAFPGTYTVTVNITDSVTKTVLTKTKSLQITDAVKSGRVLSKFNYNQPTKDILRLFGVLRLPSGDACKQAKFFFDIGGVQLTLNLDGKGNGAVTSNMNVVAGVTSNNNVISGTAIGPYTCQGTFKILDQA